MSNRASSSAALPIAYVALRILVVINWFAAAAILTLLLVSPNERWIMQAFDLSPSRDTDRLIMGLRTIAMLGLAAIGANYLILKRLIAMVETVRAGEQAILGE